MEKEKKVENLWSEGSGKEAEEEGVVLEEYIEKELTEEQILALEMKEKQKQVGQVFGILLRNGGSKKICI